MAVTFYGCGATSSSDDENITTEQTTLQDTNLSDQQSSLPVEVVEETQTQPSFDEQNVTIEEVNQTQSSSPSYLLLFDEEFNSFDESLWQKADWAIGDPFACGWLPQNVDINNSKMTLHLTVDEAHDKPYASGEYRTVSTYMYGRYSVRMQASDLNGTITSFFTYTGAAEGTDWDEIDIEILGKDTTKMQLNYWRDGHEHPHMVDLGFDASEAMHLYSFVFLPDSLTWYVDNQEVYRVAENNLSNEDSLPVNAGKIIMNFWPATGIDDWSGHYEENSTSSVYYDEVKFEALQE